LRGSGAIESPSAIASTRRAHGVSQVTSGGDISNSVSQIQSTPLAFCGTSHGVALSVGQLAITIRQSRLGREKQIMTNDPDPYEQGQRAARENIPAEGNPYQDGSQEHSLWAAGHEEVAGAAEADESEGT
jgi:hypothetical protein